MATVAATTAVLVGTLGATSASAVNPRVASLSRTALNAPLMAAESRKAKRYAATRLKIKITGVPRGSTPELTVTGPGSYRKKLTHEATLSKLATGSYRVLANSVPATGGTAIASVTSTKTQVKKNKTSTVTVRYYFKARRLVPLSAPAAPQTVTGVAGDANVELSWKAPASSGGSPITDYRIETSKNSGGWEPIADSVSSSTSAKAAVENGWTYRFRVSAVNAIGVGAPSGVTAELLPHDCIPGAIKNLSRCVFTGADLSDTDLSGSELQGANFTGANLSGADLTYTRAHHANFTEANLANARAPWSDLTGAVLAGAVLRQADVHAGNLKDADLTNADLTGALLDQASLVGTNLAGSDLHAANLTQTQTRGAHVEAADLSSAILMGVSSGGLTGTPTALPAQWVLLNGNLIGPGAELAGADLGGLDLSAVNLDGVRSGRILAGPVALPTNWSWVSGYLVGPHANLTDANLRAVDLSGRHLAGAIFTNADAELANLSNADLTGAILDGGAFNGANFTNSLLVAAWLNGTSLVGADLTGADLTDSQAFQPDLTDANLAGTVLKGANFFGIAGTPAALPTGWTIADGTLMPPA